MLTLGTSFDQILATMKPQAKNEFETNRPMPRFFTSILSRLACISGLISSSLGSTVPACISAPWPFQLLLAMTLTMIPARTIEIALPMATAGVITEMASAAVMVLELSKILDRGTAPAPMPPPMMGSAMSSSALMVP